MKLVVHEPESSALIRYFDADVEMVTSEIAIVELGRAAAIADPQAEIHAEVEHLLGSCQLVAVTESLVWRAASLTSEDVRTLDAIHLASALAVEPDELIVYDRRLRAAAGLAGLRVAHPGA